MGPIQRRRRPRKGLLTPTQRAYLSEEEIAQIELDARPAVPLANTPMDLRIVNHLAASGIHTVRDLVTMTKADLLALENFGIRTFAKVQAVTDQLGIFPEDWTKPPAKPERRARRPS